MSKETMGIEQLQQLISQGPFNKWLNFTVLKASEDGVEVRAAWRDEWVVNPERRYTHGGILADLEPGHGARSGVRREPRRPENRRETGRAGESRRPIHESATERNIVLAILRH